MDSVKQRSNPVVVTEEATDFEGPFTESVVDQDSTSQLVSATPSITQPAEQSELSTGLRRSTRIRRPPQRYTDSQN